MTGLPHQAFNLYGPLSEPSACLDRSPGLRLNWSALQGLQFIWAALGLLAFSTKQDRLNPTILETVIRTATDNTFNG